MAVPPRSLPLPVVLDLCEPRLSGTGVESNAGGPTPGTLVNDAAPLVTTSPLLVDEATPLTTPELRLLMLPVATLFAAEDPSLRDRLGTEAGTGNITCV